MNLKPLPPLPDEANPFNDDALARRELANTLTRVISALREPFVLAVDAPFGMGKSTFVAMWRPLLRAAGFRTLHYNAWENDFTKNPLSSLMGEFFLQSEAQAKGSKSAAVKRTFTALTEAFGEITMSLGTNAVKAATADIVDLKEIKSGWDNTPGKAGERAIEAYRRETEAIRSFKAALAAFVAAQSPEKPVVFFVDELDRCQPLFAIAVLEHIKHLFGVSGIVFVFTINKDQLKHSVAAIYGAGLDSEGYLRRFIDLDFVLPEPDRAMFIQDLPRRLTALRELKNQSGRVIQANEFHELSGAATILSDFFDLKLRAIEQMYVHFLVAWRLTTGDVNPLLLLVLVFLKNNDAHSFRGLSRHSLPNAQLTGRIQQIAENQRDSAAGRAAFEINCVIKAFTLQQVHIDQILQSFRGTSEVVNGIQPQELEHMRRRSPRYYLIQTTRKMVIDAVNLSQPFVETTKPAAS